MSGTLRRRLAPLVDDGTIFQAGRETATTRYTIGQVQEYLPGIGDGMLELDVYLVITSGNISEGPCHLRLADGRMLPLILERAGQGYRGIPTGSLH